MRTLLILTILLLTAVSCKSPSYIPKPKDFQHHVKGLFFEAQLTNKDKVTGEIIEVNAQEIKLLPIDSAEGIRTLAKNTIKSGFVIVSLTSDNPKKIIKRSWISTLTTLAHGWFMAITFPVNLTVSVATAQAAAKDTYRIQYPENVNWIDLSRFARFPQGIPETVDPSFIK